MPASRVEVKVHRAVAGTDEFDLWQRAPQPIAVGDTFRVTAGCDKTPRHLPRQSSPTPSNFRGFPHMPGNDFIIRMPQQGEPGSMAGASSVRPRIPTSRAGWEDLRLSKTSARIPTSFERPPLR